VFCRAAHLPGVRSSFGCRHAIVTLSMIERPISFGSPAILDPGAGEAAARRYSSVTVKDEGLCQTSAHRFFGNVGIGLVRSSGWLRPTGQLSLAAKARRAVSIAPSGYHDEKPGRVANFVWFASRFWNLVLVRRRPGGTRPLP
jgi:hypothetical protein